MAEELKLVYKSGRGAYAEVAEGLLQRWQGGSSSCTEVAEGLKLVSMMHRRSGFCPSEDKSSHNSRWTRA